MKQRRTLFHLCRSALPAAVCALVITGLAFGQSSSTRDVIWLRNRTGTTVGQVQSTTPDHLTVLVSGSPEQVPVETILRLRLGDDPTGMAAVRASVQSGQFEQASTQLKSVKVSGRPVTQQDIAYHRALIAAKLALQGTGAVNDAARIVNGFLKAHPTSFRYYDACELMGDLAAGLGRFESAAIYYGKISQAKSNALSAKGKFLQGNAVLRQGDVVQAARLFDETAAAPDPRLRTLGAIGLATCAVHQGRPGEAIEQIEKVIQDNPSSDVELFARAYNTLGMAYAASGQKDAALDSYLHTDLLFYRDHEAHAEALFHLAKLWSELNKPAEAQRAKQTLQTRYAASPWAKK